MLPRCCLVVGLLGVHLDAMADCRQIWGVQASPSMDFFCTDLSNFADHVEKVTAILASPRFPAGYEACLMIARLKAYTLAVDLGEFPCISTGSYPRYGILSNGQPICPDCCRRNAALIMAADNDDGWLLVGDGVNYEDPSLYCANCSELIPAAYGDDPEA